jgi:hypothetical protein
MNLLFKEIIHNPILWLLVFVPAVFVVEQVRPEAQSPWIGMEMDVFMKQSGSIRVVCAMVFAAIFAGELAYAAGIGLLRVRFTRCWVGGSRQSIPISDVKKNRYREGKTAVHPC